MKNFIIIGNGSSGTSWLVRTFELNRSIFVDYERYHDDFETSLDDMLARAKSANDKGLTYCNKIPFELTIMREPFKWAYSDWVKLSNHFHIIFNYRALTSWIESWNIRQETLSENKLLSRWESGWRIYYDILEVNPDKVVTNCYDEFLTNPERNMKNLYSFLDLDYSHPLTIRPKNKPIKRDKPFFHWFKYNW